MKIAIASGKGGTGKTTVATNLAVLLARQHQPVRYLDCDVEEPNGHLFLRPQLTDSRPAAIPVPLIDAAACTACGACVSFCQYKALVRLGTTVMPFAELCHGCGGCSLVCPQGAISQRPEEIGRVETGSCVAGGFVHGRLNIGAAMSPPLIRAVLRQAADDAVNLIDAPPGTSCPVIAALRTADFVVLVTEPTPFGLNDLGLALEMVRELGLAHGVVINRHQPGDEAAETFCARRGVPILARIADERRIAEAYSRGQLVLDAVPGVRESFVRLWDAIRKRVRP